MQYVSFSRSVALALKTLRARVGEERAAFARVMVFANRAMQTRAALEEVAAAWLAEAGVAPPGNGAERAAWEGAAAAAGGASFDTAAMSPAELADYEAKKLKMQKAMGEKVAGEGAGVAPEEDSPAARRLKTIAAMEGGDWSAVIDAQTQETLPAEARAGGPSSGAAAAASGPVTSPFARAAVHRAVGNHPELEPAAGGGDGNGGAPARPAPPPMTVAAVDAALEEVCARGRLIVRFSRTPDPRLTITHPPTTPQVRPYLIADGGNVRVASVEAGVVTLELQGACGTCPSSSATMKMGIERALAAAFGDALVAVRQVGGAGAGPAPATAATVDSHLNVLRGAVAAYDGSVEVKGVGGGVATLLYKGPKPIAYGLQAAVKDKFPDLAYVVMVDADSGEALDFDD
jgi:Fe-S cluster biogenesis protein NfuA